MGNIMQGTSLERTQCNYKQTSTHTLMKVEWASRFHFPAMKISFQ